MSRLEIIKQDINFLDKPLWFQDSRNDGLGFVWRDIDGYEYRTGYKLPDKVDIIILLCLLLKTQTKEYQTKIEVSHYEILNQCDLPIKGDYYRRLEDSLKRWKNVSIEFSGTFYDGKKYFTLGFGIINDYKIDEKNKRITVNFNENWLLKIKESTFFKYINFHYYKALKRPISRRLYELLCKTFK
ncbi:MAG: replication initiator protein A, partial [Desulfobacterales bacterium]|nr:replication initiator protein A [Desulfobacterales bacterium]